MARNIQNGSAQALLPERMKNTRALLCVLVIMAFLAALSMLFARGAARLSADWRAQLTNSATVQVMISSADSRGEEMKIAQETLQNLLTDTKITPLSDVQAKNLLKPWLGNTSLPADLPVPGLITLESANNALPAAQIKTALSAQGILANIDDHTRYASGLKRTSRGLVFGSFVILILLLIASLAVNVFATRASLIAQKDIINVLVQVGASNKFIARLFIEQAARRALVGAIIGAGFAIVTWIIFSANPLGTLKDSGLVWNKLSTSLGDTLYLIALCLFFTLICAMAAGISALTQLSKERRSL
ncbi:MAG: FtsX-like permease family protein [Litorimonas sp.]